MATITRRALVTVFLVAVMEQRTSPPALDSLDARQRDLDPRRLALRLQLVEELFLGMHLGLELQLSRGRHVGRVGVDRLGLRKIRDRRKRLGRLEDLEVQAGLLRLDRRRHPVPATADDCPGRGLDACILSPSASAEAPAAPKSLRAACAPSWKKTSRAGYR